MMLHLKYNKIYNFYKKTKIWQERNNNNKSKTIDACNR